MMQKMELRQAIRYSHVIHEAAIHVPHRTCHLPELTRYPILLTRYLIHYTSIYKIKNKLSELTRYLIRYASTYKIIASAIKEYCFDGTSNWNLWGNSVGARDFSPDWKHRYFGTEVPCPDNDKHQFVGQLASQIPI